MLLRSAWPVHTLWQAHQPDPAAVAAQVQQDPAVLRDVVRSLPEALPRVQWIVGTAAHGQDSNREDWLRNPAMGNYKAYAEFKMAHYDSARHVWEVLASVGNADALFNLGILAEDGLGEPRDINKALSLYAAAADGGGFKAQYRLGMIYSNPQGPVPRDLAKARYYLNLAARSGDRDAQARLAALDAVIADLQRRNAQSGR